MFVIDNYSARHHNNSCGYEKTKNTGKSQNFKIKVRKEFVEAFRFLREPK